MQQLTKEQAKKGPEGEFATDHFEVEEWGAVVEARGFTGAEIRRFNRDHEKGTYHQDPVEYMAEMIVAAAVPFDAAEEVMGWPYSGIRSLWRELMKYSGIELDTNNEDDEPIAILEEAEGNSEPTPG